MLHTVNKSPFQTRTLDSCLRHATPGSAILLIEDGVYGAVSNTPVSAKLGAALADKRIYALGPDLEARGMSADRVVSGVQVVDYNGFVDLVVGNNNVQAWL